jgi:uncharacterized protein (TIGR03118 family)
MWVSVQGSGVANIYTGLVNGGPFVQNPLIVDIPDVSPGTPGFQGPTGQVFNTRPPRFPVTDGANTAPALFIFASLDGGISAWSPVVPPPPPSSVAHQTHTTPGAAYTGLGLFSDTNLSRLFAADPLNGRIDVFDENFAAVALDPGAFSVPGLDPLLRPFNVEHHGGQVLVTYENIANPTSGGAVAGFDINGQFNGFLIVNGPLAAPWGLELAPEGFGSFAGALLVGNNAAGDGRINAFDPVTGNFLGSLRGRDGDVLRFDGLWDLHFGNGVTVGDPDTLFFTAGAGNRHGLLGAIRAVPAPSSLVLLLTAGLAVAGIKFWARRHRLSAP